MKAAVIGDEARFVRDKIRALGFEANCSPTGTRKEVYAASLKIVENASIVVAYIDDLDSDTGMLIGYAVARGKTVIGFSRLQTLSTHSILRECLYVVNGWPSLEATLKAILNRKQDANTHN